MKSRVKKWRERKRAGEEERDTLILAIESSCDETAASVVKNGRQVLSNVISSQIELHKLYGGVVPEIASRKHIEKINQVIEQALADAKVTLDDLDAVGVTYGPGLVGALLVGVAEAKAIKLCEEAAVGWRASYRRPCVCELYRASGFGTAVFVSDCIRGTYPSGDCGRFMGGFGFLAGREMTRRGKLLIKLPVRSGWDIRAVRKLTDSPGRAIRTLSCFQKGKLKMRLTISVSVE